MLLNEINGYEHQKRAIEVALVNPQYISIKFIGNVEADILAHRAKELGLKARAVSPCYCGNFSDPDKECSCSANQIKRYRRTKKWIGTRFTNGQMNCEMEIEVPRLSNTAQKNNEPEAAMLARVAQAKKVPSVSMHNCDKTAKQLFEHAQKQLNLDLQQVQTIEHIACAIAQLANFSYVNANHIAEALQYRAKN